MDQYSDTLDYDVNIVIFYLKTSDFFEYMNGVYIKTWQGGLCISSLGSKGDVGGGSWDSIQGITYRDVEMQHVGLLFQISQYIHKESSIDY